MNNMIKKIINFGFVGIIATIIDYCVLIILKEIFHVDVLIASVIAFCISLVFNYLLSMKYVFVSKESLSKSKEISIFFVTAIIGLGINQCVMYIFVRKLSIYYIVSKVFATSVVMIWNFITRHIFLEKN